MLDGLFAFLDGAEAATNPKNGPVLRTLAACFCALMVIGGLFLLVTYLA